MIDFWGWSVRPSPSPAYESGATHQPKLSTVPSVRSMNLPALINRPSKCMRNWSGIHLTRVICVWVSNPRALLLHFSPLRIATAKAFNPSNLDRARGYPSNPSKGLPFQLLSPPSTSSHLIRQPFCICALPSQVPSPSRQAGLAVSRFFFDSTRSLRSAPGQIRTPSSRALSGFNTALLHPPPSQSSSAFSIRHD